MRHVCITIIIKCISFLLQQHTIQMNRNVRKNLKNLHLWLSKMRPVKILSLIWIFAGRICSTVKIIIIKKKNMLSTLRPKWFREPPLVIGQIVLRQCTVKKVFDSSDVSFAMKELLHSRKDLATEKDIFIEKKKKKKKKKKVIYYSCYLRNSSVSFSTEINRSGVV